MNLRKNIYQSVRPYWLLVVLLLTAPFVLYIVAQILPIGDDFSYFTASYPKSLHDRLFPFGSWWRPFDALLGHYLEMHSQLFPLLFPFFFVACSEVGQLSTQLLFFSISVRLCWVLSSIPTA